MLGVKKDKTMTLKQPQNYLATAPEMESLKAITKIESSRAMMAGAQNALERNKKEVKDKREKRLKDKKKRKEVVQVDDSSNKEDSLEEE